MVFPKGRYVDALRGFAVFAVCIYFCTQAEPIVDEGWEFAAPQLPTIMSIVLWVLLLEAVRRAGGWSLFGIALTFSLMPLVSGSLPGPFAGLTSTLAETAVYPALSIESIFGLPFRAFANLVIGFLFVGIAL